MRSRVFDLIRNNSIEKPRHKDALAKVPNQSADSRHRNRAQSVAGDVLNRCFVGSGVVPVVVLSQPPRAPRR